MATEVEFESEELKRFLRSFRQKLSMIANGERKYAALMSAIVYQDIVSHFEKEQGSEGKWKEWSKSYRNYLEKIDKSGNKILQFTGRLRQNFKPQNVRSQNEGLLWYNDAKVKGSDFPYAFAHNEGGPILPKRDFMWLSDNAIEKMSQQTLAFILDEGLNG